MKLKKINFNLLIISLFILITCIANHAVAAGLPSTTGGRGGPLSNKNLQSILKNIRDIYPAITSMTLAISFICGIGFIVRGVWGLHNFGQMQMQNRNELFGPFVSILVGAALIYVPSTTQVFSNTIFGNVANNIFAGNTGNELGIVVLGNSALGANNPNALLSVKNKIKYDEDGGQTLLKYVDIGAGLEWVDLMNTVVIFIQMVGFIAFVRGWFIISHSTGSGAQQGTFTKGLIHLIGGVIAINFVPFMETMSDLAFG